MSEPTGLSQSLSSNLISNNSNTFTENSVVNTENSASFNSMTVTEASVGTEKFENSGNTNSKVHPPIETRSIIKTSSDSTLDSKTKKELESQLASMIKESKKKLPIRITGILEKAYALFIKTGEVNTVHKEASLLHHACAINNKEMCEILLKLGADINISTEAGTPLYLACSYPKTSSDLIKFFLEKGANPNLCATPNTWADPDIWPSTYNIDNIPSIYYTSRLAFIDINEKPRPTFRNPLLHCIVERSEIVDLLIDKGADVNYQDIFRSETYTPMYYAVASNNFDMIKLLLDKGANNFNRAQILNIAIKALNNTNFSDFLDRLCGKPADISRANYTNKVEKIINLLFDRIGIPDDSELLNHGLYLRNLNIAKRLLENVTIPTSLNPFESVGPNCIMKPYNIDVILFVMVKFLNAKLENNNNTIQKIDIKPFERILNITELLNQQKNNDSENILEDPKFKVIFMLRHLGAIQDPEQIKIIEQIFGFDPFSPLKLSQYCATVIIKAISNSDNVTDAINTLPLPKTIKDNITTLSLY